MSVSGKYKLIKKIGSGSFGDIFIAVNNITNEKYAVKIEPSKASIPTLFYEYKLYKILNGVSGIPHVHWFGNVGDHNVMIMDLLGPSLEALFDLCGRTFSLKTVIMLSVQILRRIEFIHSKNFLHRDIKPDNFLMGLGELSCKVFVIDFGLSKRYFETKSQLHISFKDNIDFTGTPRYASINALQGKQQSRRDDLEAALYMMLYFLKGRLPWQGLQAESNAIRYKKIAEIKQNTPLEVLCDGLPIEFVAMLKYVRELAFYSTPDYGYLQQLLKKIFVREKFVNDGVYDWVILSRARSSVNKTQDSLLTKPQADPSKQHIHSHSTLDPVISPFTHKQSTTISIRENVNESFELNMMEVEKK